MSRIFDQMKKLVLSIISSFLTGVILIFSSCRKDEKPTLTTAVVTNLTDTTAASGGTISNEGSGTVNARGVCWSSTANPTVSNRKTSDGTGAGAFTSKLTALTPNTPYHLRAYATNSIGTAYGNEISFATRGAAGTVKDIEGTSYSTIEVGTQVWMAENLKTTKYPDGAIIPIITDGMAWAALTTPGCCWYNNDEDVFKATYGALYNWYSVNPASNGGKNICPAGWHVPTDVEWATLENYLITNGFNYDATTSGNKVAKSMAATSGWAQYEIPGTVGNDQATNNNSGFTALPGGARFYSGYYTFIGTLGGWWSSIESSQTHAYSRFMDYSTKSLEKGNNMKIDGFSVRCLRDY
jgi:uncharacterized protein (TIGR02145 family)